MQWDGRDTVVISRASSGIYLILDSLPNKGSVIVPANLCYAGIYPVLYAGDRPSFCDVDRITGNVTWETFRSKLKDDVIAAIIPHMYGLPVRDMPMIAAYCQEHNILLIEDCASAMGAISDYPVGHMGDYTVYSTGYSKTLNLGFGGLICSDYHPLAPLERKEKELPLLNDTENMDLSLLSKLYRLLRNEGRGGNLESSIYALLPQVCKNGFIHCLSEEKKQIILRKLKKLSEYIAARKDGEQQYRERLCDIYNDEIMIYPYEEGSVPWRFNLLITPKKHKKFIELCLKKKLPISDWYPCVTPMFADCENYPGAFFHERSIVNFPLPLLKEQIDLICEQIIEVAQSKAFRG